MALSLSLFSKDKQLLMFMFPSHSSVLQTSGLLVEGVAVGRPQDDHGRESGRLPRQVGS